MAILKFAKEALAEGAFLFTLKKAWDWGKKLYDGFGIGVKVKDYIVREKGWEDESLFALALSRANLEPGQKKIIEGGVLLTEERDKENGTKFARNFRLTVVENDKNPDYTDGIPGNRPSLNILEYVGSTCNSKEEVFLTITVMGAMHDPAFSFEKFVHIAKTSIWPFLCKEAGKVHDSLDSSVSKLEECRDERREKERLASEAIDRTANPLKKGAKKLFHTLSKYVKN